MATEAKHLQHTMFTSYTDQSTQPTDQEETNLKTRI